MVWVPVCSWWTCKYVGDHKIPRFRLVQFFVNGPVNIEMTTVTGGEIFREILPEMSRVLLSVDITSFLSILKYGEVMDIKQLRR